jgi:hypothetical protein
LGWLWFGLLADSGVRPLSNVASNIPGAGAAGKGNRWAGVFRRPSDERPQVADMPGRRRRPGDGSEATEGRTDASSSVPIMFR